MGISCRRNGHWAATNRLSCRGLVQPSYSDLNIENLAFPVVDFMLSGFHSLRGQCKPIVHPCTKF